jgi:hypothetical protein
MYPSGINKRDRLIEYGKLMHEFGHALNLIKNS